jgi:hypothetical protein
MSDHETTPDALTKLASEAATRIPIVHSNDLGGPRSLFSKFVSHSGRGSGQAHIDPHSDLCKHGKAIWCDECDGHVG